MKQKCATLLSSFNLPRRKTQVQLRPIRFQQCTHHRLVPLRSVIGSTEGLRLYRFDPPLQLCPHTIPRSHHRSPWPTTLSRRSADPKRLVPDLSPVEICKTDLAGLFVRAPQLSSFDSPFPAQVQLPDRQLPHLVCTLHWRVAVLDKWEKKTKMAKAQACEMSNAHRVKGAYIPPNILANLDRRMGGQVGWLECLPVLALTVRSRRFGSMTRVGS